MGGARALEEEERPYRRDDQFRRICAAHIKDEHLLGSLPRRAADEECALCGQTGDFDLDDVNDKVWEAVRALYTDDVEWARDTDGELVFLSNDADDVIDDVAEGAVDDSLLDLVRSLAKEREWLEHNAPGDTESEWLEASWQRFCDFVMHESRFLLKQHDDDHRYESELDPIKMLSTIDRIVTELARTQDVPEGTRLFRARAHDGSASFTPDQLGAPPRGSAFQGRMNPAGISYFYGAEEADTAAVEVHGSSSHATVATFRVRVPLRVVDLCDLEVISAFDVERRASLHRSLFLLRFAEGIAKPIERDDRIHKEYAPTQALTEFFRYRAGGGEGAIDGIRFASARRPSGHNVVLFYGQEGSTADSDLRSLRPPVFRRSQRQILEFERQDLHRYGPPTVNRVL
jgi:hypothetical protein